MYLAGINREEQDESGIEALPALRKRDGEEDTL
jgi:hypothetical protein